MHLQLGSGRLLALLRGLEKRSNYASFLADLHKAKTVAQGYESYMAWKSSPSIIASDGFSGCIGLIIAGRGGVIMGHYSNTNTDIARAQREIPKLISANTASFAGGKAYLFAQVKLRSPTTYVSEPNNLKLEAIVKDNLGLSTQRVKYIEPEDMMVDDDDELLDDCPEELLYGAMMVKHPGGAGAWEAIFVDMAMQKTAAANS
ncbi:hypothetical protein N7495_007770 [Penicillium taxi]|uniref:uncharacterized protein n=1 Tax=Penicillium taxi TaxID=168475 RepID=UPI0025453309|nr:uncharacterized protein N7495_007770 [Penicillium taxi]KAJ5887729.1 hypothetical protein N7495_007770 [Penicillium taxi]